MFKFSSVILSASLLASCSSEKASNSVSAPAPTVAEKLYEGPELTEAQEAEEMAQARESQLNGLDMNDLLGLRLGAQGCSNAASIPVAAPKGQVVFTFDDGPDRKITPYLLDVLAKHKIKATFFVLGRSASVNLAIMDRIYRDGHIVASHSWSHPNFQQISDEQTRMQIQATEKTLKKYVTGPKYYRYPYGVSSCIGNRIAKDSGYEVVGWHVDSCDWGFNATGTVPERYARICGVSSENESNYVRHVVSSVKRHNGGIILFHDAGKNRTIPQLEQIILQLKAMNYTFTTLDNPAFRESIWR